MRYSSNFLTLPLTTKKYVVAVLYDQNQGGLRCVTWASIRALSNRPSQK
jgi:hypothetical protein